MATEHVVHYHLMKEVILKCYDISEKPEHTQFVRGLEAKRVILGGTCSNELSVEVLG